MMTWDSVFSTKCLSLGNLKNDDLGGQTAGWCVQFGKSLRRLGSQMCIAQTVLNQFRLYHV
jgi:hypothetical protein